MNNPTRSRAAALLSLFGFLALVVGAGLVIGFMNIPGAWYAGLDKPPFNPPNWVFAPVWTTLYVMIAIAGWRVWLRDRAGMAMKLWWVQLVLNWAWSPVFFSAHALAAALAIILPLLGAIIAFIVSAWSTNRIAAFLFMPYAVWVGFATTLNASLLMLN